MSQGMPAAMEAARQRKHILLRAPEGVWHCWSLDVGLVIFDSDCWTSKLSEKQVLTAREAGCFKRSTCSILLQQSCEIKTEFFHYL
jgi:hypothetical protein